MGRGVSAITQHSHLFLYKTISKRQRTNPICPRYDRSSQISGGSNQMVRESERNNRPDLLQATLSQRMYCRQPGKRPKCIGPAMAKRLLSPLARILSSAPNSKQGFLRKFEFAEVEVPLTTGRIVEIFGTADYISANIGLPYSKIMLTEK